MCSSLRGTIYLRKGRFCYIRSSCEIISRSRAGAKKRSVSTKLIVGSSDCQAHPYENRCCLCELKVRHQTHVSLIKYYINLLVARFFLPASESSPASAKGGCGRRGTCQLQLPFRVQANLIVKAETSPSITSDAFVAPNYFTCLECRRAFASSSQAN